jgi:hypothetical protein
LAFFTRQIEGNARASSPSVVGQSTSARSVAFCLWHNRGLPFAACNVRFRRTVEPAQVTVMGAQRIGSR